MNSVSVIEIKNLKKTYGVSGRSVDAVKNISLTVHEGEIFGLLGPNGAGKTTTMKILTTLLRPTLGTVKIAGFDLFCESDKVRRAIGYVSQSGGLERSATGRENLILQARVYGMIKVHAQSRADDLIKALNLSDFADRMVETYSGGQRRRFDIALGMVHYPKILFLDEPTVGLDPQSRSFIWHEIKKIKAAGTTVFFTTHYLDEADLYCDRIAIVDHGNVVALDTPSALKKEIAKEGYNPTLDDVFLYKTGHTFKHN